MPPPDRYEFGLHTPHPNVDIDAMRRLTVQTLAGVDDAYWLTGLLSELLAETLAAAATAAEERHLLQGQLQQVLDRLQDLTERVTALEPPLPPEPALDQEAP